MDMKKSTLKLLALLMGIFALSACELVDLDSPGPTENIPSPVGTPASEAALLTELTDDDNRTWEAVTFELEGLNGFQDCRLDDTFTFFGDGTYRYDGGEVLCGGADDRRIKTGVWEADYDNLNLIFDRGTSLESIARISGIENNRMELLGQVRIFGQLFDINGIYEYTAE